jgi:hypothetical protein
MKKLTLEEKELKEVLDYLGEIPKKYADPIYNSLVKQFQEQNPEEEKADESEGDNE